LAAEKQWPATKQRSSARRNDAGTYVGDNTVVVYAFVVVVVVVVVVDAVAVWLLLLLFELYLFFQV
jgi:hypothetical protein